MRIERLEIENVSGIPGHLSLELGSQSLLLYGENGTGKSSLIEAIEYLLGGRVANLPPPRSSRCFDPRVRNLLARTADTRVTAQFRNGTSLTRLNGEIENQDDTVDEWVSAVRDQGFVLRRKDLLEFIDSKPSERYQVVRRWLQLDELDTALSHLRAAVKLAANRTKLTQEKKDSKPLAAQTKSKEFRSFDQMSASFHEIFAACDVRIPKDFAEITTRKQELLRNPTFTKISDETLRILESWASGIPPNLQTQLDSVSQRQRSLEAAQEALSSQESELDFLLAASELLKSSDEDHCPLCKQNVDIASLTESVNARLRSLQQVKEATRELRKSEVERANIVSYWREAWRNIPLREVDSARDHILQFLERLDGTVEYDNRLCSQALSQLRDRKAKAEAENIQAREAAVQTLDLLSSWPSYREAVKAHNEAKQHEEKIRVLYSLAQQARNTIVQEKLDEITEPVREFYEVLHPGEKVKDVKLVLPAPTPGGRKDETAEIEFTFEGQKAEDPRVHLSDGHLDTLGLAFFLMNLERKAANSKAVPKFLMLDDVISSVDATHRTRFTRELLRRFKDWQLIITTHDKIWFRHLIAIGQTEGFKSRQRTIRRWCPVNGPDLRDVPERVLYIKELLDQGGDPSTLVGQAGILMEELMNGLRQNFGFRIDSRRDDRYDLVFLFEAFKGGVKGKNKKIKGWLDVGSHEQVVECLDNLLRSGTNIRNAVGAHFNPDADHLTETEADEFASAVLQLHDSLVCSEAKCKRPIEPLSPKVAGCRCGALVYPKPQVD